MGLCNKAENQYINCLYIKPLAFCNLLEAEEIAMDNNKKLKHG